MCLAIVIGHFSHDIIQAMTPLRLTPTIYYTQLVLEINIHSYELANSFTFWQHFRKLQHMNKKKKGGVDYKGGGTGMLFSWQQESHANDFWNSTRIFTVMNLLKSLEPQHKNKLKVMSTVHMTICNCRKSWTIPTQIQPSLEEK